MRDRKKYILGYGIVLLIISVSIWETNRVVTVISEDIPPERRHCIVIDPGHGGEDGGASSRTGKPESAYNLEIGVRLNDLLHLLGYDTVMTRTEDISIYTKGETLAQKKVSDLRERLRIVNDTQNAVLISIHQNYYSDGKYRGAQVFYSDTPGSAQLAKTLQDSLISALNPGSKRASKPADGIYLMEHIKATGVLVECGFLSNPEEDALLQDPAYQKRLCCVIAASVSQFLDASANT